MKLNMRTIHGLGIAIALSTAVAGTATAAQMKAAGPAPGDCKRAYESIVAPSAPQAQAMWVQHVSGKFGNKWAHWVGAKDQAVIPMSTNSGTQFLARAKPCYYEPVL